jgi:hypothetical protein
VPKKSVVQKPSLGLAKDLHDGERGAQPISCSASLKGRVAGRCTILRLTGVRTLNTPSFPLKGCKKIVMIVTIVTR